MQQLLSPQNLLLIKT